MASTPRLTPRDLEVAAAVWQCFKGGEPQVDYEKLAQVANFKNANSASACWGPIKKRLLSGAALPPSSDTTDPTATPKGTPKKPTTPRKRKVAATQEGEGADTAEAATPKKGTPKARKTNAGKKVAAKEKAKEEVKEEDGEGEGGDGCGGDDSASTAAVKDASNSETEKDGEENDDDEEETVV